MDKQQWLYLLRLRRPEMLQTGPTAEEQAAMGRHAEYLATLATAGVLVFAGRTQVTEAPIGLALLLTDGEAQARDIMENDPAVREGVMQAELSPYRVAFGNADSFRMALPSA